MASNQETCWLVMTAPSCTGASVPSANRQVLRKPHLMVYVGHTVTLPSWVQLLQLQSQEPWATRAKR